MIADRYLERRFREGYSVGFKEGYAEGWAEIWAEARAEQCQRIRRILDHPPTELTPETRAGLTRALTELENAPVPEPPGYSRRRDCCRNRHRDCGCGCGRPRG